MNTNKSTSYTAAVIGAGSISKAHMAGYLRNPSINVKAVVDPSFNARLNFKNEYEVKNDYSSMEDLFNDFVPDIVSICTWHSLHHEQTIAAANAGVKAIICEKPMSIGSGPASKMLNACNDNNVKLVISHQRRFSPGWEKARELISNDLIGTPLFIELKALEGLLNWATHNIDGSKYIVGDPEPEWVFGAVERTTNKYERNTRIEDSCMGLIQYTNQLQAFIQSDLIKYDYESKWATNHPIIIRGSHGTLDITEFEVKHLGSNKNGWVTIPADIPKSEIDPIGGDTNGKLVAELISWIEGGAEHRCSGRIAKDTLDIMMSIYQSARINQKVIFPVSENDYPLDLMFNEGKIPLDQENSQKYDIRGFLERSDIDETDYNKLKLEGLPHHLIMQKVKRI